MELFFAMSIGIIVTICIIIFALNSYHEENNNDDNIDTNSAGNNEFLIIDHISSKEDMLYLYIDIYEEIVLPISVLKREIRYAEKLTFVTFDTETQQAIFTAHNWKETNKDIKIKITACAIMEVYNKIRQSLTHI